ncbi:MAG: Spy/CpxP family protein refolding chaperone [Acidobacteria bacterium]|nr:Spy/CpxP family protein refolding chaperone [Acidobacteriota bacterium]
MFLLPDFDREATGKKMTRYMLGFAAGAVVWLGMFAGAREAAMRSSSAVGSRLTSDVLAKKLELNVSQKNQVNSILDSMQRSIAPVEAELQQTRRDLIRALAEARSRDTLRQLRQKESAAHAQIIEVRSNALARIFALLNDTQKARARSMLERFGETTASGGERNYRQAPETKRGAQVI